MKRKRYLRGSSKYKKNQLKSFKTEMAANGRAPADLHRAARNGHSFRLRQEGVTPEQLNAQNELGETPLHLAVIFRKHECVKQLILEGANTRIGNIFKQLPLHLACSGANWATFQLLFNEGGGVIERDHTGRFCLHFAAATEGNGRIIKELAKTTNVNVCRFNGQTSLYVAAKAGNLKNVKELIALGVNAFLTDKKGRTALHAAATEGHAEVVHFLTSLMRGGLINAQTKHGMSALMTAIQKGRREAAIALIIWGADCSLEDKWHQTAMDYSVHNNLTQVTALLQGVEAGDIWLDRRIIHLRILTPQEEEEEALDILLMEEERRILQQEEAQRWAPNSVVMVNAGGETDQQEIKTHPMDLSTTGSEYAMNSVAQYFDAPTVKADWDEGDEDTVEMAIHQALIEAREAAIQQPGMDPLEIWEDNDAIGEILARPEWTLPGNAAAIEEFFEKLPKK